MGSSTTVVRSNRCHYNQNRAFQIASVPPKMLLYIEQRGGNNMCMYVCLLYIYIYRCFFSLYIYVCDHGKSYALNQAFVETTSHMEWIQQKTDGYV